MKDFFISYNKADRAWAEWIAWQLEEEGYSVVVQAWDFRPSSNFVLAMQQGATEAERTIAVLSPDYLAAQFTQPEWAAAFAQDPTGEKGKLLPVRVRECDPTGLLGPIVYIDLVGLDEAAARAALLAGVNRGRAKPRVAPEFPGSGSRTILKRPRFPGTLPSIWNVPHHRNPNFTGREQTLADLHQAFYSGQQRVPIQVVHGLGGVGKTQVAVEYAFRHLDEYDVVWWVRAEEPTALAADYALLATKLDLPQKDAADQTMVVEAVRAWLEQHSGWLLIFDNARAPDDVRPYLPRAATGHILITSRNPHWRSIAQPVDLQTWERDESVAFLLKRTGQTDEEAAGKLAVELGHLPLALEQAGAYIDAKEISIARYLELFLEHRLRVLERSKPGTDYPATVATTWELAFQEVERNTSVGADLLRLCAYLAPDDIPRDLLRGGEKHLPESLATTLIDPLAFDEAVEALLRYSLMDANVSSDSLSIHRLVQAVVRHRMAEDERKRWAEAAVRLINGAFPYDSGDVRTWSTCAQLLSHAIAVTGHAQEMHVVPEVTGRLLNQMGVYLRGRADFAAAKATLERSLAIVEAKYGSKHPEVATVVNNLGSVLRALGDLHKAKATLERALAIVEATYGPNHPKVAAVVNNLGGVLHDLGDLPAAKAAYERALAIGQATYGSNHPKVASCVNNLGTVLRDLGALPAAKAAFERALTINVATYGPNHPKVAAVVNNLGGVLHDLGDLPAAKAAYERAIAIGQATYGPNHPTVASRVNNLGVVLRDLGDLPAAKAAFERALAIDEASYGPNHLKVANDLNNLGGVLRDLGDLPAAKAAFERAFTILRESLGHDHPHTAVVRSNLNSLSDTPT